MGYHRGANGNFARLALSLVLGAVLAVVTLSASATQRTLRFERLAIEQGLSPQTVLTVMQDRQGFMWFGTQAGLHRFDGYRMTVYRNEPDNPASIPDNYVTASFEDAQGRLWFGTKGGLARFDPASGKFNRFVPEDASPERSGNPAILAIVPARDGGLWLATGYGLRHFDTGSGRFRTFRHDPRDPHSLRDDRVQALALDARGGLWIGTPAGVDRLDTVRGRFEHLAHSPDADARRNDVLSLSMGPRDTLWVGTAAGLEAWRLGEGPPQRRRVKAAEGVGSVQILALYHDHGANLWVGTDVEGLKWRDPADGRFVTYRNQSFDLHSLSDNRVGAIWVDGTGVLWVGTVLGGVNRADLASGGFVRYIHTPGQPGSIPDNQVRAMVRDSDGRLWVGTRAGGLARLDPDTGLAEPVQAGGLPGPAVSALALAPGRLWVGTLTGLLWRDQASGQFNRVPLGPEPAASHVQSLHHGRDGTLWIVTRGGLFARDAVTGRVRGWRHDPQDSGSLGANYGYAALEDRRGDVWIATDNGLDRFDRASGKFTHFRHDPRDRHSLRHNRVYYLFESSRGELWVGTAGGLHRMEAGPDGEVRFRFFPLDQSQEAMPIGAVLEGEDAMLWISTTAGITRLDPRTGHFKNFTAKDGLIDGSYFVGAGHAGADGQLYFGGINGMTSFRPGDIRENPYPPAVKITEFRVFNRPHALGVPVHEARAITLSHRDTVFSLEFAALHYADPQGNRYAYRLEGFDRDWVDTDAFKRFATYTNLDPGRYVFRVRASNKDGVWSEEPATLAITITPPVWQTWWFRTLAAALALAAAYAGYRLRVRALLGQKRTLEREVGARTAELVLQKESAERRKHEVERQKEVVEQAHRNISLLSEIGRKLTANLDSEAIMRTLYEHVHALMDARTFAVILYFPERTAMVYPFAVVDGERCEPAERAGPDCCQLAAWCIEHGSEVFIGELQAQCGRYLADVAPASVAAMALPSAKGRDLPCSLLYVPIVVGARVLGALTVQSPARDAYDQVHLDMLRTLSAYVGVAIDNAQAYRQLKETQAQLAAQEKLASLGSLVAGVAHELNTPIGNSLLMATTLQEQTSRIASRFEEASLRRSELEGYIATAREASGLITRSLHNAAELVSSFRQVSVDQASVQRRRFDLGKACREIVATMLNKVRLAGHAVEFDVPAGLTLDSYPGPLGQVLINFVNNALLHAFDGPGGTMRICAALAGTETVRLEFSDDGRGIPAEHLARIFDPFFTTRMGQGGTGLGLNIVYNIVTGLLGGTIRVDSAAGEGTRYTLELPLRAPRRLPPDGA